MEYALTTIDNPFSPFDDFDRWYQFDMLKGTNCCGLLDRVSNTSDSLSESENDKELNRAIDEIIKYDFQNIYRRVTRDDFK